jgi:hypothetical protein
MIQKESVRKWSSVSFPRPVSGSQGSAPERPCMPSPGAPRPAAPWGLFPVRRPLSEVPASGAPPLWRKTVLYHPPPREGKPERRVVEGCTQLGEGGAGRRGRWARGREASPRRGRNAALAKTGWGAGSAGQRSRAGSCQARVRTRAGEADGRHAERRTPPSPSDAEDQYSGGSNDALSRDARVTRRSSIPKGSSHTQSSEQ